MKKKKSFGLDGVEGVPQRANISSTCGFNGVMTNLSKNY